MKHALSAAITSFALVLTGAVPALAQQAAEPLVIKSGDKSHTFQVKVITTKPEAEKGLAGHAPLAKGEGVVIDYRKVGEPMTPTMKGVTFDLDLLYLAPDGTIVGIVKGARAGSLRPLWTGMNSVMVLEIPAGQVAELGIKTGDKASAKVTGNAG